MSEFKKRIAEPISLCNEANASVEQKSAGAAAGRYLKSLLDQIMLRRTQADVLKKLLPPRTDYVIYCAATAHQQAEYNEIVDEVKR